MRTASVIARLLLGIIFLIFGLNGFLHFLPASPPTGVTAQFVGAIFASGFWVVIFSLQIIPAVLLLMNRYVPLALTLLGPVIVNIFFVHLFMAPSGMPLALLVTTLWIIVYVGVRSAFAGLFQPRVQEQAR
jgi:putative oxidoreductase